MLEKVFMMTEVKTGKQGYKLFQIQYYYETILTFLESCLQAIIHTFAEFLSSNTEILREVLPNNIDLFRAHVIQYLHKVITKQ